MIAIVFTFLIYAIKGRILCKIPLQIFYNNKYNIIIIITIKCVFQGSDNTPSQMFVSPSETNPNLNSNHVIAALFF